MQPYPKRKFKHSDLKALNPCPEAWEWAKTQKSAKSAWENCERCDWLLWLLERIQPLTKPQAVAILVEFAKGCLGQFETRYPRNKRPRQAIEAAENWLKEPSETNVSAAWSAGSAAERAIDSASRSCAWAAADAARYAANAALSAGSDANAADLSAANAAWSSPCKKRQAEIIRKVVPCPFK